MKYCTIIKLIKLRLKMCSTASIPKSSCIMSFLSFGSKSVLQVHVFVLYYRWLITLSLPPFINLYNNLRFSYLHALPSQRE